MACSEAEEQDEAAERLKHSVEPGAEKPVSHMAMWPCFYFFTRITFLIAHLHHVLIKLF